MFSRLLLKIAADGTCMETIDQVVVKPFVKGATDAVEVRWGSDTPVTLESGSNEDHADIARGVSS
jgi:hypothetical protein